MSDGGKGSKPRPYSVSQAEYDGRWDAIFCRDLKDDESPDSKQSEKTDAEKHETKT
jgi:hypothetical protein